MCRVAHTMLSLVLLVTGAQANEKKPSRQQLSWVDLNLDFTAQQPLAGVAGGLEPS